MSSVGKTENVQKQLLLIIMATLDEIVRTDELAFL